MIPISFKKYLEAMLLGIALLFLLFFEDRQIFLSMHCLIYAIVAVSLIISLFRAYANPKKLAFGVCVQLVILTLQVVMWHFSDWTFSNRFTAALLVVAAFMVEYYTLRKWDASFMPHTKDSTCVSFADIKRLRYKLGRAVRTLESAGKVVNMETLNEMIVEIPRNNALRYIAQDSLSEEYLQNLVQSVDDRYVYLVLSDTGSVASNVIGVITRKPYSHVSIAFDAELQTLVSYNGGQKISPPGLNAEVLAWFCKKEDSSIRIYRLAVAKEQKQRMIDKVLQINQEGSAYNWIGPLVGRSFQPNIMFCSQFVYCLLEAGGVHYFDCPAIEVRPADFVEQDYDRKLEFVENIRLSDMLDDEMAMKN